MKRASKETKPSFALELPLGQQSAIRAQGRFVKLKFFRKTQPELLRIEFCYRTGAETLFWHQGHQIHSMTWREVPQALSLLFLEYVCRAYQRPGDEFEFCGEHNFKPVRSLCNAIDDRDGKLHKLIAELPEPGPSDQPLHPNTERQPHSLVKRLFSGKNIYSNKKGEKRILVSSEFLPADCVEIFWERDVIKKLETYNEVRELLTILRQSLNLPPVPDLENLEPEPTQEPKPALPPLPPVPNLKKFEPKPERPPRSSPPKKKAKKVSRRSKKAAEPPNEQLPNDSETAPDKEESINVPPVNEGAPSSKADSKTEKEFSIEFKETRPREPLYKPEKLSPIPRDFFEIKNPQGLQWKNSDPLINFGVEDNELDLWRIRDASEGVAVFGAVGSGKTSSSGYALATAMLTAGYGAMVMTAKPDEARRWIKLCEETGRSPDCIHVTATSGHQLNILQYESERPGNRVSVTDDLIALFRALLDVMEGTNDATKSTGFWTQSVNMLLKHLLDVFLLAKEPITIDAMLQFVEIVPTEFPYVWETIPIIRDLMSKAEESARNGNDTDKRIYDELFRYWTKGYPTTTEVTRSGILTNFTAMASALSGRGVYEIISTGTNLTPEMILSGKVVILDLPLKMGLKGNLMIQAALKLLFQQAVERRSDKGKDTARPIVLWEDEAHEFFSHNDVRFQPTARDCRACHVMMSQNLHNFLHLGHERSAVMSVFAAMNTYIFHCNGERDTNEFGSQLIGNLRTNRLKASGNIVQPFNKESFTFVKRRPEEIKNVGSFSVAEKDEPAVRPEDFGRLKRGGDGTSEAIIVWLSHKFAVNQNRNFCVRVFNQEPR